MTERELRALTDRSQEDGFRAIFQQYHSYVYAIIWRRICAAASKEDAEECVSDVFAEAFLHFAEIHEGALQGYLATLANRTAIDCYRKLTVRGSAVSMDDDTVQSIASEENVAEQCEEQAVSSELLQAVRSLGEPDATIILHRYFYDRSASEIAETLHMQPVTVRVRMSRALKRLKTVLSASGLYGKGGFL
ncbi:MAG: sigma-70 family RNA polymerase sigma factor [Oscillospiraceae bacterium]|nr:sigma-70 family RNA polymerase sigma factor [Oscillospiraceae bacterium]